MSDPKFERLHPRDPRTGEFVEKGTDWASRLIAGLVPSQRYYHGTVAEDLEEILPARQHGRRPTFPFDTDQDYAYASTTEEWARHWAEKAHAAGDAGTLPRVYEVEPIDPSDVEEDEFYDTHGRPRSINPDTDRRSRSGWRVLREMPWPDDEWGDPEGWR